MSNRDIKFLVDVGVGNKVEVWLDSQGFDTKVVRDLDPRMTDNEILQIAVDENRIVITMDKDFGELIYHMKMLHAGVILLRLDSYSSEEKTKIIQTILEEHKTKIIGNFSVYKDGRLRIRYKYR